ncbi:hypothetical protein EJC49_00895 [Aquibium carbonis]|uniref:Uncharacterized protein n=1 Tax=Aquibium carbonis TaxID=2495581 RepID=A0A3S0AVS3_9HYPH|nr:hypothetical protein [Aquibium carbonis]RST88290.1 hypothetical protein EJC49_00895 [Aquibium carbonis]
MSHVALILVRFAVIIAGYVCAALAASTVLHLAWIGAAGFEPELAPWVLLGSIAFSIPFVALFIGYFAFLPALVAIAITEFARWQDWLTYALAGGAIAIVLMSVFWGRRQGDLSLEFEGMPQVSAERLDDPQVFAALLAAGFVGGIGYWIVAGRGAGKWRRAPRARIPPLP